MLFRSPYAAPRHPVIWQQILKCFAKEMIRHGIQEAWDCVFCMNCMQLREAMPYETIQTYLNIKLGKEKEYTNEQIYNALGRILQETGGNGRKKTGKQDNKLLMI